MSEITLKEEVAELLRKRAQEAGIGLNEFLSNLLKTPTISIPEGMAQRTQSRNKVATKTEQISFATPSADY